MQLESIAPDVWSASSTLAMPGFPLPIRMTVIRLPSGGLWLHSPVPIDDALAGEIDALGPVAHIVAPSLLHHLFAAPAKARWPAANLWAAPGLAAKRADVAWDATLDPDALPQAWGGAIDAILIAGAPKVNELVFFHAASSSLLVTDLLFHILQPPSLSAALALTLTGTRGKLAFSRAWRFAFIKDRAAAHNSARRLLQWPFARLIPCHGEVLERDTHAAVGRALGWLTA